MTTSSERNTENLSTTLTVDRLRDEAEIRNLTASFADAVNLRNAEKFRTLWLPQGSWKIQPPLTIEVQGLDEIVATFTQLLAGWEFFVQRVQSGVIEIAGERATARWCMDEIGKSTTGKGFHNLGIYVDELVKAQGIWLFAGRTYHFIYIEEPTLSGHSFSVPLFS